MTFLGVPALTYVVLLTLGLVTPIQMLWMILLGCVAAFAMELPLYVLGWRHPPGHIRAPVLDTILEWNNVVPLLCLVWSAL